MRGQYLFGGTQSTKRKAVGGGRAAREYRV